MPFRSTRLARPYLPIAVALAALLCATSAQARHGEPPRSWARDTVLPLETFEPRMLEAVDRAALMNEDAQAPVGPLRIAVATEISISPQTHGIWESLDDGGQLWRYRFHAPGATDLSFALTGFNLPAGATLHILSENEDYFEGPYTAADNKSHHELWTPPVPGSRAVVELYLPLDAVEAPELEISRVHRGYRDLFKRAPQLKQGSCNIDVVCPQADPWHREVRSVGRYVVGGTSLCTGGLVADVPGSQRNFFVTAFHCGVTAANASSVVVFWNHESISCGDLSGGSFTDTQTGAIFRARDRDTDMSLIELDDRPSQATNAFRAGWDRSGDIPATSTAIHHPNGDEKAISFNRTPLTTGRNCILQNVTNQTHWFVDDWEEGTTEPGSSGSGLFDGSSRRLIGFLSGGTASCSNTSGFDCFGRFSEAWDGPQPNQRLRDWLDPADTGRLRVNGSNVNGGPPTPCGATIGTGPFCSTPGCGPCTQGQGDCDNDSECAAGLTCADNVGALFGFAPGIDVCVADGDGCPEQLGNGRYCSNPGCGPCTQGQGDCDNDSECAAGLRCADNVGAQFGFAPGIDVCVGGTPPPPPPPPPPTTCTPDMIGNGRYCTDCAPCRNGEGDCDNDGECAAGLSCVDDIGAQFGFAPGVDVCIGTTTCTEGLGTGRYCSTPGCGPCGEGQGDCDNNSECAPGLTCVDNIGALFGFAPGVDVCTSATP